MFERFRSLAPWTVALLCALAASAHAAYPVMNRHAEFSGASYISVPNTAALNATLAQNGALTIDAWIRPASYANFPTIVGNTWNVGYWLGLNTAGSLRFYPGSGTVTDGNAAVPLGVWTHVAVTFSDKDNEVRFYINGALDRIVSNITVSLGTSNADLRIGADRQGASASYFFDGGIDEVRIWGTAITMTTALGSLHRIPQAWRGGLYGQSLLAAWRLNGDAVDSTGGNTGSTVGTVNWLAGPASAHYGRIAAVMPNTGNTGLDYFSIPTHAANAFAGSYSLELWAYLSTGGAATAFQTFVCKGSATFNSFSYWLGVNKQNGRLRFAPNGVWSNAVESTDPLPTGQWVHVAATWSYGGNSGTARVYINGVPRGSQVFNGAAPFNQSPLLVGAADMQSLPAAAYALAGRVDELRLWNLARTDAEIANTHRLEYESPVTGLTGVYHFDGDILDASLSANHGSNTNLMSSGLYYLDASALPAVAAVQMLSPNGGESWPIGAGRSITWSAVGVSTVQIELSRDGGVTWPELLASAVPASSGTFGWTVTGPESPSVRVRVRTSVLPQVADTCDANIAIVMPPPVLSVAPASFSFAAVQNGATPAAQLLQVTNTGSGTLTWNASWSSPWLGMTPASGTGSGTSSVSVLSTVLPPGIYLDTLLFTGNASNMPLRVPVSYTVTSVPILAAEPAALEFAAQTGIAPQSQTVRLRNLGSGGLAWTAVPTVPWLSITPASGGDGDSIEVSVNVTGFAPGTYNGSLSLGGNATNVPFVIPVQLVVSTAALHPVSGLVTSNGTPLAHVEIRITGDSVLTITTGADGRFSVSGLREGAYTVTAVSAMYAFAPVSHGIAALTGPRTDLNFSATPTSGSVLLRYRAGWNLISLPVDPADRRIATLLPDAVSGRAFRYAPDTGYVEVTSLAFGVGYWIKFTRSDSVRIDGQLRGDLRLRLRGAGGGWNLTGSASGPVTIGDIRQFPADALIIVYQYDPGIGYRLPPDNLFEPGRGYYMKVSSDADLSLTAPALRPPPDDALPR